ncbi:MAG TPA: TonB family protein [Stellaceae bacterium]|nr:TonB family protein [Stellaceae bacterium]
MTVFCTGRRGKSQSAIRLSWSMAAYNAGMSVADGMPPAIMLPADPGYRESRDREEGSKHLRRGAIAAALLAHVAVIAALLVQWPTLFPAKPLERPPIPVTLVQQVPPPPAPQVKPAPPPPPPPPEQHERVSGADTKTTAPPPEADKGEEAAPKPTPPPPTEAQANVPTPESKPTPPQDKAKQEKPKVAKRETTLKPSRGAVNRAPGEHETEGDPYLNALFAQIESHRFYPQNAIGSLGLPLEGTVVYLIEVRADGALTHVALARSSGADILDQTALKMIKQAAPFPPPPRGEFPGPSAVLEVTIHLFPGMG